MLRGRRFLGLRWALIVASGAVAIAGASAADHQHAGAHSHGTGHDHNAKGGVGEPGAAADVSRAVRVEMSDGMRFQPSTIEARQGETVRFVVANMGKLRHEFILGSEAELKAHDEAMKTHPGMEHDAPNMLSLAPGKTGEIVWRFTSAGRVDFACLQPGHYAAGMKGAVDVARSTVTARK
ncbi:cupredoxin family protein [Variovorax humicola]|uniref:Cupredoxin family protein n=1 Tax=Variovorax humicola TaxID=1769758 RepID=A0ABU8W5G8_9BURK